MWHSESLYNLIEESPMSLIMLQTCQNIKTVDTFMSSIIWREYRVKTTANCKTSNVVYVIKCNKRKLQYVGEMENAPLIRMKVISQISNIDVWKNQWLNILI